MIKKDCFAYNDEKNECNACKDLKCQNCAFYKEKGKKEMTVKEALDTISKLFDENDDQANEAYDVLEDYISQQEKKDELLTKIKDILALNYSYQEIGIKIERLFREGLK